MWLCWGMEKKRVKDKIERISPKSRNQKSKEILKGKKIIGPGQVICFHWKVNTQRLKLKNKNNIDYMQ